MYSKLDDIEETCKQGLLDYGINTHLPKKERHTVQIGIADSLDYQNLNMKQERPDNNYPQRKPKRPREKRSRQTKFSAMLVNPSNQARIDYPDENIVKKIVRHPPEPAQKSQLDKLTIIKKSC